MTSSRPCPRASEVEVDRPRRPPLLGEVVVVLGLVVVYDHVRDVASTRAGVAIAHAARLLTWESAGGLDVEQHLNAALARHHTLQAAGAWYYQLAHVSVTLTVLVWCYWQRPAAYRGARNALLQVNAAALIVFWLYPVAPPRLLPHAGFVDSAVVSGVIERTTSVSPDLYAAMPSLHLAWAVWVAVMIARTTKRTTARIIAATHVLVTAVVVVATANHYLLDLAAGASLTFVCLRATVGGNERRGMPPPVPCRPNVPRVEGVRW